MLKKSMARRFYGVILSEVETVLYYKLRNDMSWQSLGLKHKKHEIPHFVRRGAGNVANSRSKLLPFLIMGTS